MSGITSLGGGLPSQTGNNGKYLTTNGTTASWATVSAGISGSTGSVDNAVLRADGTGGSTVQSSAQVTIDDNGTISSAVTGSPTSLMTFDVSTPTNWTNGILFTGTNQGSAATQSCFHASAAWSGVTNANHYAFYADITQTTQTGGRSLGCFLNMNSAHTGGVWGADNNTAFKGAGGIVVIAGNGGNATTAFCVGGSFAAYNGNQCLGVRGLAIAGTSTSKKAAAVVGQASTENTTTACAGIFRIVTLIDSTEEQNVMPSITSGIIVDNASVAAPIATFMDNATAVVRIADGGAIELLTNASLAGAADTVQLGAYDISAGHRTLAIGAEEVVTTEVVVCDTTFPVRINGVNYKFLLHT